MCDFEAGPLTAEDREAAAAGHALMAVTADTVKLLLRQMVRGECGRAGGLLGHVCCCTPELLLRGVALSHACWNGWGTRRA